MKRTPLFAVVAALAVLLLLQVSPRTAMADGSEALGAPSIAIASGSGIVAAGVGLDAGPGTISIVVPGAVQQALLYAEGQHWADPGATMDVSVNGSPVTMGRIGGPTYFYTTPVAGVWRDISSSTYRADITSMVASGANALLVDGLDFNYVNNGAGVLVIYDDGTSSVIDLRDGNDLAFINFPYRSDTTPVTFTFAAASADRVASLSMFFSSIEGNDLPGQRPSVVRVWVDGVLTVEAINVLDSHDGREWDTLDLPFAVPAGATSVTAQAFSQDALSTGLLPASLAWSAAGLAIQPVPANPAIDIEKATNGEDADTPTGPMIPAGGAVTWTYVVTNTGDVALASVTVVDDQGVAVSCPQDTLAVGEAMTCTGSGTAALGQYANVGSTTGTAPDGTVVTDADPSHYFGFEPPRPAIDIEKATNGEDADSPTGPEIPVGGSVTWTYVVTNTGNVVLADVVVTDDLIGTICTISLMNPGDSVTCTATGVAVVGQYANIGSVTGTAPDGTVVTDADPSHYLGVEPPGGGEGCTPGYWKQDQHLDSWAATGYSPSDSFDAVFGVSYGGTLLEAAWDSGGDANALARHAVAALLNASSPDVDYAYSAAEVIALVQGAFAGGDFEGAKDALEVENELGCPLD